VSPVASDPAGHLKPAKDKSTERIDGIVALITAIRWGVRISAIRPPGPQPTVIKLLKGNPGKRPLNPDESRPEPKPPAPADDLGPIARREWTVSCRSSTVSE
jgi:hypothetical protein